MLDRICKTLRIAAAALAGAWAGYALWQWWDFSARPGLYAMQSAPWYTGRFAVRRGCRGAGPGAAGGRLAAALASAPAGTLTGREGQIFCRRADGPSGQAAPRMV